MEYRSEIDGLRALAVLPVIFFHAGFEFFKGGFVGVDIFFVISGYLITSIIIHEIKQDKFSLVSFYERRARRILPALFFTMALCLPLSWFILMPHQFKDYGQSQVAAALFSSNFLFWLESGYFEPDSELKPLLHTWSLAIEEQFYIVFPIILLILHKSLRLLFFTLCLIALGSFLFAENLYANDRYAAFFLLPTRAWELMCGAICAMYLTQKTIFPLRNSCISSALGLLGIGMIAISIFTFDQNHIFPSLLSALPAIGTMLIILFVKSDDPVGRKLSIKPLVYLGLISYSAYLLHQPIFAFVRVYTNTQPNLIIKICLISAALIFAYFTYKFVEQPFRNKSIIAPRWIFTLTIIGTCFFIFTGYLIHKNNGFVDVKLNQIDNSYRHLLVDFNKERSEHFNIWYSHEGKANSEFDLGLDKKRVLILGDSISRDFYLALVFNQNLFQNYEFRRQRLDDECFNYLGQIKLPFHVSKDCKDTIARVENSKLHNEADIIIFTATWQQHTYKNALKAIEFFDGDDKEMIFIGSASFNDMVSLSYQIAKTQLPYEQFGRFFAQNKKADKSKQSENLENILKNQNAKYFSKYDALCHVVKEQLECPLYSENQKPLMIDTAHLTKIGIQKLGQRIKELEWLD